MPSGAVSMAASIDGAKLGMRKEKGGSWPKDTLRPAGFREARRRARLRCVMRTGSSSAQCAMAGWRASFAEGGCAQQGDAVDGDPPGTEGRVPCGWRVGKLATARKRFRMLPRYWIPGTPCSIWARRSMPPMARARRRCGAASRRSAKFWRTRRTRSTESSERHATWRNSTPAEGSSPVSSPSFASDGTACATRKSAPAGCSSKVGR